MPANTKTNFILQQGFSQAAPRDLGKRYHALLWQPRIVGTVIVMGTVFHSPWLFLALAVVLWGSALAPHLNPFDFGYNLLVAGRGGRPRLTPAPAPRRFSQGMAGTFALAIGVLLLLGLRTPAYVLQGVFLLAAAAVALGGFCAGAFVYHLLRGRSEFATSTLPWARPGGRADESGKASAPAS